MAGSNGTTPKSIIDFKGFRKERQRHQQPLVIDFGDERLEMPAQMPAGVMLDLMAWMEEQGTDADISDIPTELAMSIMTEILGGDQLRDVARRQQMDMDELMWLLEQLLSHYMGDVAAIQEGNAAQRPARASTSSKTGR